MSEKQETNIVDSMIGALDDPKIEEYEICGMKIRLVPINQVAIAETNVRCHRDEEIIDRVRNNIGKLEEKGIEMPLLYPPLANNDNEIFEGGYRLKAMKKAGKPVIPLRILDIPADEQVIISLSGGIQHPLSGEDEAKAIAKLKTLDSKKWTHEAIGEAIGRSQAQVTGIAGLNKINKDIKDTIDNHSVKKMSAHVQTAVAKIDDTIRLKPEAEMTKEDKKTGKISREDLVKIASATTVNRVDDISKRVNSNLPIDWNKEKKYAAEKDTFELVNLAVEKGLYTTYRQFAIDHNMDLETMFTAAANYYIKNYATILAMSNAQSVVKASTPAKAVKISA